MFLSLLELLGKPNFSTRFPSNFIVSLLLNAVGKALGEFEHYAVAYDFDYRRPEVVEVVLAGEETLVCDSSSHALWLRD